MSKGFGSTRGSSASNPKGMGGGNFSPSAKLSDFSGSAYGNGGTYTMRSGQFEMTIETESGYNSDLGMNGTAISVYMRKGNGSQERIYTDFVEGTGYRASMGQNVYANNEVTSRINRTMPYISELANNWKKRNL